ncbi:fimbrial protein [Salmonella enterica subsp. enterica serovar Muenchen]|nr:fimbrial protein [Salmonella enterica subsp. enterica serovar Muenchen]
MNKAIAMTLLLTVYRMVLPDEVFAASINTNTADTSTKPYKFSGFSIPSKAGEYTWFEDWGEHWKLTITADTDTATGAYITFTVNGTPTGTTTKDDATVYKTNNPGIGIAYQMTYNPVVTTPDKDFTEPYRLDLGTSGANGNLIIRYILVRLTDELPAGPITDVPSVTVTYHNSTGSPYPDKTFVARSGVANQPAYTACGIDAPTEIKLDTLYGKDIHSGAQNITNAPTITLTNCPGAINGISYNFSAVYGTHDATNAVLSTATGEEYAKNVYVQMQNTDGTPYTLNTPIPVNNYRGSGDYILPGFKVAYFIDDPQSVTAGNVKTAIELKVTYN